MEQDIYCRVEFWFRIRGLAPDTLEALQEAMGSRSLRVYDGPRAVIPGAVVSLDIEPDFPIQTMTDFLRDHGVPADRFGVYVSMSTESDHNGIAVPEHVLEVIRGCGGQLDVSFTVV